LIVGQTRRAVAPVAAAESLQEQRALGLVEQQVVHLVGVLVLHDTPGELACVQEIGVEPDLVRYRARRLALTMLMAIGPGTTLQSNELASSAAMTVPRCCFVPPSNV
jgi:hypothetical protein